MLDLYVIDRDSEETVAKKKLSKTSFSFSPSLLNSIESKYIEYEANLDLQILSYNNLINTGINFRFISILHLICSAIDSSESFSIGYILKNNFPLKTLDLSFNKIDNDGVIYLFDSLVRNDNLNSIFLLGNKAQYDILHYVERAMRNNGTVKEIILPFTKSEIKDLAILLVYNKVDALLTRNILEVDSFKENVGYYYNYSSNLLDNMDICLHYFLSILEVVKYLIFSCFAYEENNMPLWGDIVHDELLQESNDEDIFFLCTD